MSMLYHGISVIVAFKNGEIKEHCTDFCNEIRVDLCEKKDLFMSISDWDGLSDDVLSAFHTPYDDIGDASWDEYAAIPLEDFMYEVSIEDVKNIYSVVLITNHDNDWGPRKLDWKKISLNPYAISTGSYELEADVDLDGCEMRYALEKIIPEVKSFKKSKSKAKKSRNGELSDGVFTYFLYDENSKRCQSMASVDYWVDNDDVCITGYLGEDSCVEIPEYIDGKPVTVIYKISGGKNLKRIHFKNSKNKMHVEPDAFKDCESIEEMIIAVPEKIYFIDGALSRCKKLISDGFVIIDGFLFDDIEKNKRKVLEIPEGVKKIGYGIYNQCKNIEEIVLPKSLITVVSHGFEYCSSLKKITINGKTKFEDYTLYGCTELEEVVVNGEINIDWSSDESIFSTSLKLKSSEDFFISGSNLFSYSGEKEFYSVPEGIEVIGPSAFKDNIKLKKVNLPDSVKCICNRAFDGCRNLEEINFPEGLVSIGNDAFHGCGLKKVVFNKNLERIGRSAFEYCHNLSEVNISPATVCESKAFNGCNTKELSREDGLVVINGVAYDYYYSKNAKFYNTPDDISRVVLSGDVKAITNYFFNSPGDTLDEFVITNAIKKIPTGAFFLSGIKCLKILDSVSGELIFETSAFKGRSYDLLEGSNKFARFCELVEAGDYETIKSEFSSKTVAKKKTSKTSSKNKEPVSIKVEAKPIIQKVDSLPVDESLDFTDEQICAEWLEKYGEYLAKNPKLEIKDKTFVFSGIGPLPIFDMDMEDSTISLVIKFGGFCRSKISGKTDYLIVNPVFAGESKVKAAIEQLNKGNKIQIVLLDELQDFLIAKLKNNSADSTPPKKSAATSKQTSSKNDDSASKSTVKKAKTSKSKISFPEYEVKDSRKKLLNKSPELRKAVHSHGCDIRLANVYDKYLNDDEKYLARLLDSICADEKELELREKIISKAKCFSEIFACEEVVEAENDKFEMIKSGYLKTIYQLHAFRSFAWTLTKWAKTNKKELNEVTIEELIVLADFIENAGGANYNSSSGSDDTFCASVRPKIEVGKIYMDHCCDVINTKIKVGDECYIGSIGTMVTERTRLWKDLEILIPAMETIYQYLLEEKKCGMKIDSTLSDVLFAWTVFAFASRAPFAVVKGPEKISFERTEGFPEEVSVAMTEPDSRGYYFSGELLFAIKKDACSFDMLELPEGIKKIAFVNDFDNEEIRSLGNVKKIILPVSFVSAENLCVNVSVEEVTFCEGSEKIFSGAFSGCHNLKKINLPHSLKIIEENAFRGCSNLKRITIPVSVEEIQEGAFDSVYGLEGPNYWLYNYGREKFDFVFEVYKDSYAEKYAKAKGWYHTVILTEEQKAEKLRKEAEEKSRQEAARRAEQERIAEAKRREELRKRREEEERKRLEATERVKRVARYRELLEEEKTLLQTIDGNKGLFGEKARKRKEAKRRLEEVRNELEDYKDLQESLPY